jgi:hypothetical protein
MVVLACNPSYTGSIGRKVVVGGWPLGKDVRPYLKNN